MSHAQASTSNIHMLVILHASYSRSCMPAHNPCTVTTTFESMSYPIQLPQNKPLLTLTHRKSNYLCLIQAILMHREQPRSHYGLSNFTTEQTIGSLRLWLMKQSSLLWMWSSVIGVATGEKPPPLKTRKEVKALWSSSDAETRTSFSATVREFYSSWTYGYSCD